MEQETTRDLEQLIELRHQLRRQLAEVERDIALAQRREQGVASIKMLTVPEVAEVLKFTEQRVYELIRQGHLTSIQIGKYVRVPHAALHDFIERSTRGQDRQRRETRAPRQVARRLD